jgi:uncharacterized membrane protein HdeD (DUF308 family)
MRTAVLTGILLIIAGIVVLAWDDALRWAVGIALLVTGVLSIARRES